jgi:hypothetical protein
LFFIDFCINCFYIEITLNDCLWGEDRVMLNQDSHNRRSFIGGSDARIIMGNDEAALLRLWREKRGEVEPEDLSGNLIVQLGAVTEELNRRWYEAEYGPGHNGRADEHPTSWAPLDGGDA